MLLSLKIIFRLLDIRKLFHINPLSANPTKWSNTLKEFFINLPANCLSVFDHFWELALERLRFWVKITLNIINRNKGLIDFYVIELTLFYFSRMKYNRSVSWEILQKYKFIPNLYWFNLFYVQVHIFLIFNSIYLEYKDTWQNMMVSQAFTGATYDHTCTCRHTCGMSQP